MSDQTLIKIWGFPGRRTCALFWYTSKPYLSWETALILQCHEVNALVEGPGAGLETKSLTAGIRNKINYFSVLSGSCCELVLACVGRCSSLLHASFSLHSCLTGGALAQGTGASYCPACCSHSAGTGQLTESQHGMASDRIGLCTIKICSVKSSCKSIETNRASQVCGGKSDITWFKLLVTMNTPKRHLDG